VDRAAGGVPHAAGQAEDRALPRTVGPQHDPVLAAAHREGDAGEDDGRSAPERDVGEVEGGALGHGSPGRGPSQLVLRVLLDRSFCWPRAGPAVRGRSEAAGGSLGGGVASLTRQGRRTLFPRVRGATALSASPGWCGSPQTPPNWAGKTCLTQEGGGMSVTDE